VILDPPRPAVSRSVHTIRLAFVGALGAIAAVAMALLLRG
jgi:hypothetical protein